MKKKKMRVRLREHAGKKEPFGRRQNKLAADLQKIAEKRSKITEDLRNIRGGMMSVQQLQQAGMLAHYALLAMILGSLITSAQKSYYEKQLKKLGDQEMDSKEKMEQLKQFEQHSKEISGLKTKAETLGEAEKAKVLPKIGELEAYRDGIAAKLKLAPTEYDAMKTAFDGHFSKLEAAKQSSVSPLAESPTKPEPAREKRVG